MKPTKVEAGQRRRAREPFTVVGESRPGVWRVKMDYGPTFDWLTRYVEDYDVIVSPSPQPTDVATPLTNIVVQHCLSCGWDDCRCRKRPGIAPAPAVEVPALLCRLGLTCPKHYPKKVEPYVPTIDEWDLLPDVTPHGYGPGRAP